MSVEDKYTNLKLKAEEYPDVFVTNMEFLVQKLDKLGKKIPKEDLVVRVLNVSQRIMKLKWPNWKRR